VSAVLKVKANFLYGHLANLAIFLKREYAAKI